MIVDVELEAIGGAPPSINRVGSRGSWRAFHGQKVAWQGYVGTALLIARGRQEALRLGRFERAIATATIAFTTKRRRDEGNFRAMLEKATGDALVEGGFIPDDDVDRFTFGALELVVEPELAGAETRLRIRFEAGE